MNIASFIDHTLLSPTTTADQISKLCVEAAESGFAAVCIPPYFVAQAKEALLASPVKVATVIGFPFGYQTTETKLHEAEQAITQGATELDMVHNLSAFKGGEWKYLHNELDCVLRLVQSAGVTLKLIVESGILTSEELLKCCNEYGQFPLHFMKTSTGYAEKGASVEAVQVMRRSLPPHIEIKASGGIRTFSFAQELILAGATRIGCSASMHILQESKL